MKSCFAYTSSLKLFFTSRQIHCERRFNIEMLRVIIALKDKIRSGPPLLFCAKVVVAGSDANCRSEHWVLQVSGLGNFAVVRENSLLVRGPFPPRARNLGNFRGCGCCQPAGPALPPLLCPLKLFHKLSLDNNKNTIVPLAFAWRFGKTPPKHQTETDTNRNPSNSQHFLLPLSTWYGGMGKRVEVVLFLLEIRPLVLPREVMLTVGVLLKNQG